MVEEGGKLFGGTLCNFVRDSKRPEAPILWKRYNRCKANQIHPPKYSTSNFAESYRGRLPVERAKLGNMNFTRLRRPEFKERKFWNRSKKKETYLDEHCTILFVNQHG